GPPPPPDGSVASGPAGELHRHHHRHHRDHQQDPGHEDPTLEALAPLDPRLAVPVRPPLHPPHGGEQHEGERPRERGDDDQDDDVFGHWDRMATSPLPRHGRRPYGGSRPPGGTLARSHGPGNRGPPHAGFFGWGAPFDPERVVPT